MMDFRSELEKRREKRRAEDGKRRGLALTAIWGNGIFKPELPIETMPDKLKDGGLLLLYATYTRGNISGGGAARGWVVGFWSKPYGAWVMETPGDLAFVIQPTHYLPYPLAPRT